MSLSLSLIEIHIGYLFMWVSVFEWWDSWIISLNNSVGKHCWRLITKELPGTCPHSPVFHRGPYHVETLARALPQGQKCWLMQDVSERMLLGWVWSTTDWKCFGFGGLREGGHASRAAPSWGFGDDMVLQLAKNQGLCNLTVFTDAESVVTCIYGKLSIVSIDHVI